VARPDIVSHQVASRRCSQSRKAGVSDWKISRVRSWKHAMIRRRPSPPSSYLSTPPPEGSPRSLSAGSDCDADDEETMSLSTEDLAPSRPHSAAGSHVDQQSNGPYAPARPTLPDVLSNAAPPPWTLSAFTAYLSQNHCLENLEFTMDADRYRERFDAMALRTPAMVISTESEDCKYLKMLWQRLMDAYIIQDGSREINIPSNVRETLLSLPNNIIPPRPEELDEAIRIIYNLMEESVLIAFLNDVPSPKGSQSPIDEADRMDIDVTTNRHASAKRRSDRSRSRRRGSPSSSSDMFTFHHCPRPPPSSNSSLTVNPNKIPKARGHSSSGSGDASLTDDSLSASNSGKEPMTPPTTPPSSDIGGTSPKHRSDTAWKKMLVWKKKSSTGMRDARIARVVE